MPKKTPSKASLVQLSDLHFNKVDPEVVEQLKGEIARERPDLVIVSGDLTMRARRREFVAARAFLDEIASPWIAVPGNHDIPSTRLLRRMLFPYQRYRTYISSKLTARYEGDTFAVYGLNTSQRINRNSWDWSRGRVSNRQLEEMKRWFESIPASKRRIAFTHHPLLTPKEHYKRGNLTNSRRCIRALEDASVQLSMSGHFHHSGIDKVGEATDRKALYSLRAPTATSTRTRGERNGYNSIVASEGKLLIQRRLWVDGAKSFVANSTFEI